MAILGILQWLENSFILIQDKTVSTLDNSNVIYEHSSQLTCVAAVQNGKMAITDVEKNVILLSCREGVWSKVGQWRVPKCPTSCTFYSDDDDMCYVSDKFGQVFVFPPQPQITSHVHLSDNEIYASDSDENKKSPVLQEQPLQELNLQVDKGSESPNLPLLGHVSMLTKVVLTDKFIITADRDEKIRITDRLRPYLIHAFLLNHTSYIADLFVNEEGVLISADGDGRICWWNLQEFSLTGVLETNFPIRQLYVMGDVLVVVEDDSPRVHLIHQQNEFKAVFDFGDEKVHFACSHFVSTLNTLYKIDPAFGTKTSLLSTDCITIKYEPKGRIAKRHY